MSELESGEVRCETADMAGHPLMSSRPPAVAIHRRPAQDCAQMGKGFLRPRPSQRSSWQVKLAVPRPEGVTFFS